MAPGSVGPYLTGEALLGPYLTGEAQAAVKALPKQDVGVYKKVKEAILDRFEITPETSRQKLRTLTWTPGGGGDHEHWLPP